MRNTQIPHQNIDISIHAKKYRQLLHNYRKTSIMTYNTNPLSHSTQSRDSATDAACTLFSTLYTELTLCRGFAVLQCRDNKTLSIPD